MTVVNFLKIFFSLLFAWVCYVVITTSLKSNLFTEWNFLGSIPWMRVTLWDFYANATVIFLWVCYKENKLWSKLLWLVLLVILGSIASCAYVLLQLFKLKPNEDLKQFFGEQNG